jgi:hypothetical protein
VGRGLRWMLRTVSGLEAAAASSIARGRRYVVRWALAAACTVCFAWPAPMHAQSIFSTPSPRQQAESLARSSGLTTVTRQKSGTAFFVDDIGHMLTARHVADSCVRIVVAKEGRAVAASVVALSGQLDIALIKVPKTLGLAAIFPRNVTVAANDMMFVAAYDTLPRMTAAVARSAMQPSHQAEAKPTISRSIAMSPLDQAGHPSSTAAVWSME